MLFKQATLERIRRGEITVAFRRWTRPTVQAGTQLHTSLGLLAIDGIETVTEAQLTAAAAKAAGFVDRAALLAELRSTGTLYRITLRYLGVDPRIALREDPTLDDPLRSRLARLDAASKTGPWTQRVLEVIAEHPAQPSTALAAKLKVDKEWLKPNVRKLKNLGLTESLEVGYQLSPKGRALLGPSLAPRRVKK